MTFIFNNFNNLINILFSQMVCFCFNHYSDYRFCSTFSYKNPSVVTKKFCYFFNFCLNINICSCFRLAFYSDIL